MKKSLKLTHAQAGHRGGLIGGKSKSQKKIVAARRNGKLHKGRTSRDTMALAA